MASVTPIWLLDLVWAGRTYRFASEPIELTEDGEDYIYQPGLAPVYEIQAGIGEVQRDIDIDLGTLIFDEDVLQQIRRGARLVGADAELYCLDGEEKRRLFRGTITLASVQPGRAATLSMRWQTDDSAKARSGEVSLDTWNGANEGVYGTPYPRIFGFPGLGIGSASSAANNSVTGGSTLTTVDVTPANKHDYVLLACTGAVAATTVALIQVYGDGTTARETGNTLVTSTDDLGQTVTTVTPIGMAIEEESKLYIDWSETDGGALRANGEPITTFGHLLTVLATESTADLDVRAFSAFEGALGGYRVDTYIDDDSSPLALIEDYCQFLPMSLVPGPDGLRPVLWDLSATFGQPLVHGVDIELGEEHSWDTDGVINEVTVTYGPKADDGSPYYTLTVDATNHASCAESQTYLPVSRETIEVLPVYDQATAYRIASFRALSRALPVERVTATELRPLWLNLGDTVLVSADDRHLTERVGNVTAVKSDGGRVSYEITFYTVPGRDYLNS